MKQHSLLPIKWKVGTVLMSQHIFFYKGLYDFLIHFKEIFDAKDTLDISLCNQRSLFFI